MVLSMGTTNTLYLPHRINKAMRFNFNTIFYVQYRSEEISPAVSVKISKDGIAWLQTTIEETSLGVFKIVSEEVIVRLGQHNGGVGLYCAWQVREG